MGQVSFYENNGHGWILPLLLLLLLWPGCVRDTQCLLYNSIESYSTHELLKTRVQSDGKKKRQCDAGKAIATATATAGSSNGHIAHVPRFQLLLEVAVAVAVATVVACKVKAAPGLS